MNNFEHLVTLAEKGCNLDFSEQPLQLDDLRTIMAEMLGCSESSTITIRASSYPKETVEDIAAFMKERVTIVF